MVLDTGIEREKEVKSTAVFEAQVALQVPVSDDCEFKAWALHPDTSLGEAEG